MQCSSIYVGCSRPRIRIFWVVFVLKKNLKKHKQRSERDWQRRPTSQKNCFNISWINLRVALPRYFKLVQILDVFREILQRKSAFVIKAKRNSRGVFQCSKRTMANDKCFALRTSHASCDSCYTHVCCT